MPVLKKPTNRQRFSSPIGPSSHTSPTAFAEEVVTDIEQNATTGNTVEDHLKDLIARSGHGQASQYATGTNYAVGAEVYWVDSQNTTHFYIRLVAGQDAGGSTPNTLTAVWREVVNNLSSIPVDGDITASNALVEMEQSHKAVRASVPLAQKLAASQSASEVATAVETWIARVTKNTLWKGDWAHTTTYAVGDYAEYNDTLYRRLTAGSDNSGENPSANAADWVALAGLELDAISRLKFIVELAAGRGSQAGYLGDWQLLGSDADIEEGNIVKDGSDGFYIATSNHTKQTNSPKADPANYDLLTNWRDTWADEGYNAGSIVLRNGFIYIAYSNVESGDDAPDSPDSTKWALISTPSRYRGEWAQVPFNSTVWEGDLLYHTLSRRGHGAATQYAALRTYSDGDEVYWVDGGGATHYYERLTDGADVASSTPNNLTDDWLEIIDRAYFICKTTHLRTTFGPDSDPARFDLLSNFIGPYQDSTWYQEGSIVIIGDKFYIAAVDVEPGDPHPTASDNVKWIGGANTKTVQVSEHDSATIEHTEEESRLKSPGHDALWAAPSTVPRGTERPLSIHYKVARGSMPETNVSLDVDVDGIASELRGRVYINGGGNETGITLRDNPPFPLPQAVQLQVTYASPDIVSHGGQFVLHVAGFDVLTISPSVPGTTSATNLNTQTYDVSSADLQHFHPRAYMLLRYTKGTQTEDSVALSYISAVQLNFTFGQVQVNEENFNTYPVAARTMRDLISYDASDTAEVLYNGVNWNHGNVSGNEHAPFGGATPAATVGNGWRIDNTKQRGYNASPSTDIVVTTDNVELGMHYEAEVVLEDHTIDSAHPDAVRMDLIRASTASTIDKNNDQILITDGFLAYDIKEFNGDVACTINHSSPYQFTYTIPDSLNSKSSIIAGPTGVDNAILVPTEGRRRLNVKFYTEIVAAPGPMQLQFFRYAGPNDPLFQWDVDTHLSHSPTPGNPAVLTGGDNGVLSIFDSDNNTRGHYDINRFYFRIIKRQDAQGAIAANALQNTKLEVSVWADSSNKTVSLDLQRTFSLNDRIFVKSVNTTGTTHSRNITIRNQKMTIWNVEDVTGRDYIGSGSFDGSRLNLINGRTRDTSDDDSSEWWYVRHGNLIIQRDARQVKLTYTAPAHTSNVSPNATIWRQAPGTNTWERVATTPVDPGSTPTVISATALAVVEGEQFFVTLDSGTLPGTHLLEGVSQTVESVPARQVHTGGLLRPDKVIDGQKNEAPSNSAWVEVPVIGTWNWYRNQVLYLMLESNVTGQWNYLPPIHTALLHEIGFLASARIGEVRTNSDTCLKTRMAEDNHDVFIAAAENGSILISIIDESAQRAVKGWVE